jgi:hypothetical protein
MPFGDESKQADVLWTNELVATYKPRGSQRELDRRGRSSDANRRGYSSAGTPAIDMIFRATARGFTWY